MIRVYEFMFWLSIVFIDYGLYLLWGIGPVYILTGIIGAILSAITVYERMRESDEQDRIR